MHDEEKKNRGDPPPLIVGWFTSISLKGADLFGVQSSFAWYYLYVYCTARSSWLDVGPVLDLTVGWQYSIIKLKKLLIFKTLMNKINRV